MPAAGAVRACPSHRLDRCAIRFRSAAGFSLISRRVALTELLAAASGGGALRRSRSLVVLPLGPTEKVAAWEPSSPVLLRQASLRSLGAAQDDFELALVDEMEVNPTLLHFLKVNFDCGFDQERLLDHLDGVIDEPWELQAAYDWMIEHTPRRPAPTRSVHDSRKSCVCHIFLRYCARAGPAVAVRLP